MSVDFSVKDIIIVITGATGLICSTLASELAGLGAVVWLCSEASSFVNGVVIPIDGGFLAYSGV